MPSKQFMKCHAVTSKWEGGWSNHSADPGGKTMYGVTEAVYHEWLGAQGKKRKSVRYISRNEALKIYYEKYWIKCGAPKLAPGVDLAVYDASVNSGVSRGRRWLKKSIGGPDAETVRRICDRRLGFMQSLRIWKVFGKGWGRRVADIKAKGMAWANAAEHSPQVAIQRSQEEAVRSVNRAKNQGTAAGGAGVGTGVGGAGIESQLDPSIVDQWANWILGGFVAVGALVVVFLIIRAVINYQQANAFERAAHEVVI